MTIRDRVIKLLSGIGKATFILPQVANDRDTFSIYARKEIEDSVEHFRHHFATSTLFSKREALQRFAIDTALRLHNPSSRPLFVEFGVREADSLNRFARMLGPSGLDVYGFDSFDGIQEDWKPDTPKGSMAQASLPTVERNAKLVVGMVQDTLGSFLTEKQGRLLAFIHMDMDTYTPTKYTLDTLKPLLRPNALILFDELHGYAGWRHHEFKALQESLNESEFRYLAFSKQQALIQIV